MSAAALTRARKLLRPRTRRESGHFLAEGVHVIAAALDAGLAPREAFLAPDIATVDATTLASRLRGAGVAVHEIDARALREIAETETPQGVVAVCAEPRAPAAPFAQPGAWLLLDRVQDPGNAGTLVRAAEAFGARGVLARTGTVDLWGGKTLRAGQGAHFHVALAQESAEWTCGAWLDALAAAGGELWAADAAGESIYAAPRPPARVVLALGNEGAGLAPELLACATRRVAVPQRGRTDSLNVALAGAVLLSWITSGAAPR